MTTMTMPRPVSGNDRIRTADYLLGLPVATQDAEALERDRARRAVQRVAGRGAGEILDILGLVDEPEQAPPDPAKKQCSRCQEFKARAAEFNRRARNSDGLDSNCRDCRHIVDQERRERYETHSYDGNIDWPTAPPGGPGISRSRAAVDARITAWVKLRTEEKLAPRAAAKQMGVCMRTARRNDAILKDRGLLPETLASGRAVA